jgi:hypothetical protein
MTRCGICDQEGRHEHRCAICGERVRMKDADWIVSTFGEVRVEHFACWENEQP